MIINLIFCKLCISSLHISNERLKRFFKRGTKYLLGNFLDDYDEIILKYNLLGLHANYISIVYDF